MREKTLLVVDDTPGNLDLIRMLVEDAGLAVQLTTATNGQEAVLRVRELEPDLVLMDLKMPVVDGLEATRRLKADPMTARIPVIALTAQAMTGDRERALAAGCDDYVTKPFDLPALLALLQARLG
jgi:two-component system, cell cycle response regulator DivK